MPKIKTKAFGEIEVDDRQRLNFPEGIFGFEEQHEFWLIEQTDSPFYWLQSAADSTLAFITIHPDSFMPDYELSILEEEYKTIKLKSDDDLICLLIVTIPTKPEDMTANLLGPIVINKKENVGKQAISLRQDYSTHYKILDSLKSIAAEQEKKSNGAKGDA